MGNDDRFEASPAAFRHLLYPPMFKLRTIICALQFAAAAMILQSVHAESVQIMPSLKTFPTVSGSLLFGEQKAAVSHLYYRKKKTDEGTITALIFSDRALARRALTDFQQLTKLARKGAFFGLYVELTDDGSLPQSTLYYNEGNFSGQWSFEGANASANNRAGRIASNEEREFFGKPYAVDVSFQLCGKVTTDWQGSAFEEVKPTGLSIGQALGWVEQEHNRTSFKYAFAVIETDLFGESNERKIYLIDGPVTDEILNGVSGPETAMHQAGLKFMRVGIDAQNNIDSLMTLTVDGNALSFSSTEASLNIISELPATIEGVAELDGPDEADFPFARFNVKFCAEIKRIGPALPVTAATGKALPKDGGAPGKAYLEFAKRLKTAKSIEELLPYRIATLTKQYETVPAEQRAQMLEFLRTDGVAAYKIVGGFIAESQATLWLEGKQDGLQMEGRVNLHLEDGTWKLGMEAYKGRL